MFKKILFAFLIGIFLVSVAQAVNVYEENGYLAMSNGVIGVKAYGKENTDIKKANYFSSDLKTSLALEDITVEKWDGKKWKEVDFKNYEIKPDGMYSIKKRFSSFLGDGLEVTYKIIGYSKPMKMSINLYSMWGGEYRVIWKVSEIDMEKYIDKGNKKYYGDTNVSEKKYKLLINYQDLIDKVGSDKISIETETKNNKIITTFTLGTFKMGWWDSLELDPLIDGKGVIRECYQESANVTNQTGIDDDCGLQYTGAYNSAIYSDSNNIDGNWLSSGLRSADGLINYTIPSLTIGATWMVKEYYNTVNFTIPTSCLSDSNLQLKMSQDINPPYYILYQCWNGTVWNTLGSIGDDTTSPFDLMEEAILWDINTPPEYSNISVNNTQPKAGDSVKFSTYWEDETTLSDYIFSYEYQTDSYCYQESANTTNQTGTDDDCGLEYTGVYSYTGTWTSPEYTNDGDWNTNGLNGGTVGTWAYMDINYTKPPYYNPNTYLYAKVGNAGIDYPNKTMPSSCLTDSKLQLRYGSYNAGGGGSGNVSISCWNGTTWYGLYMTNLGRRIWEESIYWEVPNWVNDSAVAMTGTGNWSNITKTMPSGKDNFKWRVYANDSNNLWNDTGIQVLDIDNPPTWSNPVTNGSEVNTPIQFNVTWDDDYGLSEYKFSTNASGSWVNDTAVAFSGTTNVSSTEKTPTQKGNYYWRVYVKDSNEQWGVTSIQTLNVLDTTPPQYHEIWTVPSGVINYNSFVWFYTNWTDNYNLSLGRFGTNASGTWMYDAPQSCSGTKCTMATGKIIPNVDTYYWVFYINDTSNNMNTTPIQVITDINNPPTWSNPVTNGSEVNTPIQFNVTWDDDYGLSEYKFSTNASGSWVNDTAVAFSGTTNVSSTEKTPTIDDYYWRVYAKDIYGLWNDTGILRLETDRPPVMQTAKLKDDVGTEVSYIPHYKNSSLWCNATDIDNATINYYGNYYTNNITSSISNLSDQTQGIEANVLNISGYMPNNIIKGSCLASDGIANSSWLNSSEVKIYFGFNGQNNQNLNINGLNGYVGEVLNATNITFYNGSFEEYKTQGSKTYSLFINNSRNVSWNNITLTNTSADYKIGVLNSTLNNVTQNNFSMYMNPSNITNSTFTDCNITLDVNNTLYNNSFTRCNIYINGTGNNFTSNRFTDSYIYEMTNTGTYSPTWVNNTINNTYIGSSIILQDKSFTNLTTINEHTEQRFWANFTVDEPTNVEFKLINQTYKYMGDTYTFVGSWTNPTYANDTSGSDDNWGTYGNPTTFPAQYYVNYTIPTPLDSTSNTTWAIRTGTAGYYNVTIPSVCLSSSIFEGMANITTTSSITWKCKNQTDGNWIDITTKSGSLDDYIYGESIYFPVIVENWSAMTEESNGKWYYDVTIPEANGTDVTYIYLYRWDDSQVDDRVWSKNMTVLDVGIGTGGTALCFNFKDEISETSVTMDTVEAIFTVIYNDSTEKTMSFKTTSVATQCYQVTDTAIMVDLRLQYSKLNYATREYFLWHHVINNSNGLNIDAYTINSTLSSGMIITFMDKLQRVQPNTYIKVQRFYPSQNAYVTIAMGLTDENGQTRVYLQPNDVYYRFIFEKEGKTLLATDPMLVITDAITFKYDPYKVPDIFATEGIELSVNFNNLTQTWQVYVNDPSGEFSGFCYNVKKVGSLTGEDICRSCVNTTSTTFICNDSSFDTKASYQVTVWGTGSAYTIYQNMLTGLEWMGEHEGLLIGTSGIILAILLVFSLSAVGVTINPMVSIILSVIGLIISTAMQLIPIQLSSLIAIAFSGGLLIWRMNK